MKTYLVLTIIADDKPGLVESLSKTIAANKGNWLESSMSHLAGKFAGILRVSVDEAEADQLVAALEKLGDELEIVIAKVQKEETRDTPQLVELSLVGNDRPGIIREISRVMAASAVNVEQLNTECIPAPMSGDMLFQARMSLRVPSELDLDQLQADLEKLADDLIVEIQLSRD